MRQIRAACAPAETAAQIHYAVGLVCGTGRRALRTFTYGGAAMADMAAVTGLVRHRYRDLLLLRRAPEQAGAAAHYRHQTCHERLKRWTMH